jgi:hypothetical protein
MIFHLFVYSLVMPGALEASRYGWKASSPHELRTAICGRVGLAQGKAAAAPEITGELHRDSGTSRMSR